MDAGTGITLSHPQRDYERRGEMMFSYREKYAYTNFETIALYYRGDSLVTCGRAISE
jgi:hypothetical protein